MTLSAGQSSTVCCQAKLADKDGVLDAVQGLGQAICFHSRRTHKLQQDLSLLYLLVDPLVAEGCRREINELGLSGRDRHNCLLLGLPNDWTARQENHMASCGDFCEKVVCKRRVAVCMEMKIRNVLASTSTQA